MTRPWDRRPKNRRSISDISILHGVQIRSWDSANDIATGNELDGRGFEIRVPVRLRIFFITSRPVLGPTQPPIQWVSRALSPGVKRPRSRKRGSIHPFPHTPSWHSAWLVKHRDNFIFYSVQIAPGAYLAFYPIGIGCTVPGAWSWSFVPIET
jgi:hypothetical protein